MRRSAALLPALALTLAACAALVPSWRDRDVPISSVAAFDAERYQGLWYEIASFPTPFQAGCTNTTARYDLIAPDRISVLNACDRNGGVSRIAGEARVVGPGRLRLDLDGVPIDADYWVLWIDEAYRTAVVGAPSGGSGYILNRDPTIPADRLAAAKTILAFNGYDTNELRMTEQAGR